MLYTYNAKILKVVDADTFHLEVDLGLDIKHRITVRLYGIDAAEKKEQLGKAAIEWVQSVVDSVGPDATIRTYKDRKEKYGRYLVNLYLASSSMHLNQELIDRGYAVSYLP